MIEQERKFLLVSMPDIKKKPIYIQQGYVILEEKRHLRVRIIDNKKAFLACKIFISDTVRQEFEYKIPLKDGIDIFNSSTNKVEKKRYQTTHEGNHVDIDIYPNHIGIAEIEYKEELRTIPPYCGREVTGNREYSNMHISNNKGNIYPRIRYVNSKLGPFSSIESANSRAELWYPDIVVIPTIDGDKLCATKKRLKEQDEYYFEEL